MLRQNKSDQCNKRITAVHLDDCYFFIMIRLVQNVQNQSQNNKDCTDPLGCLSQSSIKALGIAAGQKSLSNLTADAVGQTGVLARLEQNSQNDSQTAKQLKNGNENNNDLHDL